MLKFQMERVLNQLSDSKTSVIEYYKKLIIMHTLTEYNDWAIWDFSPFEIMFMRMKQKQSNFEVKFMVKLQFLPDTTHDYAVINYTSTSLENDLYLKVNSHEFLLQISSLLNPLYISVHKSTFKVENYCGERSSPESAECENRDNVENECDSADSILNHKNSSMRKERKQYKKRLKNMNKNLCTQEVNEQEQKPYIDHNNEIINEQICKLKLNGYYFGLTNFLKRFRPTCSICCLQVKRGDWLKHLDSHNIFDYYCYFCNVQMRKELWASHNQNLHFNVTETHPCRMCTLPLSLKGAVEHMRNVHHKDECPFCNDSVIGTMEMLNISSPSQKISRHINRNHVKEAPKKSLFRLKKKLYHQSCKKFFDTKEEFEDHKKNCINVGFPCHLCGKMLSSEHTLNYHVAAHNKSIQKLTCPHCSNQYTTKGSMKKHILSRHFPDKENHFCEICNKRFPTHVKLLHHSQIHKTPSIQCPRCDKLFKTRSNARQHLFSHYPPRFECLKCNQRFLFHSIIKAHLNQVHGIENLDLNFKKHKVDMSQDLCKMWNWLPNHGTIDK